MKFQFLGLAMLGVVTLSVVACTGMETTNSGAEDQAAFEQLYQQADQAYQKVAAVGGAWSVTEELLDNAKEAAAKADYETATNLVKRAQFESDMAYEQYESQKDAGPHLF